MSPITTTFTSATLATVVTLGALLSSGAGCTADCETQRKCTPQRLLSDGGGAGTGGQGGSAIPGQALWGYRFGDGDEQYARALAVDADDRIVLGGSYAGEVEVGATQLVNNGGDDAWLAVFDADTSAAWAKSFGDNNDERLYAMTTIDGDIIIAGTFSNSISLGGDALVSTGGTDVFVARLSSAGAHVWSRVIGGPGAQAVSAIAVNPDSGAVAVVGTFGEALNDGSAVNIGVGGSDGYVVWLDSSGAIIGSKTLGGTLDDAITAVAWVDGDTLLAGHFHGTINDIGTSAGESDAFLLRITPTDNTIVWAHAYGNTAPQAASSLATHGNTIVMGGFYQGNADFGGGVLPTAIGEDGYVVALGLDGAFRWQIPVSGNGAQRVNAVALTQEGEVTAVGHFSTELNVGEPLLASGTQDAFALRLNAVGAPRWVRTLGGEITSLLSVAHDSEGYAFCAGNGTGNVAVDGVVLGAAGGSDGFVLKFKP